MQKKLTDIINKKLGFLDEHTFEVVKKSIPTTAVKVIGMVAAVLLNIALGRLLGVEGLGVLSLSKQIVTIFLIFCTIGTYQVIIKEVSIARNKKLFKRVKDIVSSAYVLNGTVTVFVSIILILLTPWIATNIFHNDQLIFPLIILIIAVVPQVFSKIFSAALAGYKKIWQSNLALRAADILITGTLVLISYLVGFKITVELVAICYGTGRLCAMMVVGGYWKSIKPKTKEKSQLIIRSLLKTSVPLLFVSAALIISRGVSTIILGWLGDSKQVGLYSVAMQVATLTIFFLQITVTALSPKIAALYESKKIEELKMMVQRVTMILACIGLFFVLFFFLFGDFVLSLWGEEFKAAYWVLIILGGAQLFNIASGPVGNILSMTGHEKVLRNITFVTLSLNVILNLLFIKQWGIIGAAWATMLTKILSVMFSMVYVKKKVGFWTFSIKSFSKIS